MPLPATPHVELEGIRIDSVTVEQLHQTILEVCRAEERAIVANVNVNAMNLARDDAAFRRFLVDADYVFCDGFGVKWGARLQGHRIPERITYADWIPRLAAFCASHGLSMFLLGARPGVADRAAAELLVASPGLRIAGMHHGYFDRSATSPENDVVLDAVRAADPDILLVCFGMPAQELWLQENWDLVPARVALCGGAALDYISGEIRRAPQWMTDHGLEWLGRLLIEPRRLWKRYLIGNPRFLLRVLRHRRTRHGPPAGSPE